MTCVMSGDTAIDEDLSVFVAAYLWIFGGIFVKHPLTYFLPFGILRLRTVKCNLAGRLVTAAPRGNENDRRQEVESTQRGDQFGR